MRKLLALTSIFAIAGAALAAPNFNQTPIAGVNEPWGPIGDFSFEDDLIIDDGVYDLTSITTFEVFGDADTYTLEILDNYSDQGGTLLGSWSTTESSALYDAALDGFLITFNVTGLQLGQGTYILHFTADDATWGGQYSWFNANIGSVNGNEAYIPGVGNSSQWPGGDSFDMSWDIEATPVPEPATMAVLGLGLVAIARRRRKG